MGINGNLKQISFNLLEKLEKYPDFITVFRYAEWLPDSFYWQKYQGVDIPFYVSEMLTIQQNSATELLQELKIQKQEQYEQLKKEIPLIIEEGKNLCLELDKEWHILSFLLTGYDQMNLLPFLIEKNSEDNLLAVNAILGGTETRCHSTYGFYRYLVPNKVTKIAEALNSFSEENLRKRFERGSLTKPEIYTFNWTEEEFILALEYHKKIVSYYKDANERSNAMLLYFT